MKYTSRLIQQFNLGLDLFKEGDKPEVKTNLLINKVVNDLAKTLGSDSTVIFHSNDDTISMICYKILKVVQLSKNFKLYLYGSRLHTNKWISKEDKFISRWKVKKLLQSENTILAIPYNPLYKVIGAPEDYKKFLTKASKIVKPVEKFNFQEFEVAQIFYHIGYIKKDPMINRNIQPPLYWQIVNICKIQADKWQCAWDTLSKTYPPGLNVYGVWLTGDL